MLKWYRGRKCTDCIGWFEDVWPIPASAGRKREWDWPGPMKPKVSKDGSFSVPKKNSERSVINKAGDCSLISFYFFQMASAALVGMCCYSSVIVVTRLQAGQSGV